MFLKRSRTGEGGGRSGMMENRLNVLCTGSLHAVAAALEACGAKVA